MQIDFCPSSPVINRELLIETFQMNVRYSSPIIKPLGIDASGEMPSLIRLISLPILELPDFYC